MRYEDWDILLFPLDCKVPVKEFKVQCHVVHDAEFSHSRGSYGLPIVYCFVPSLPLGTPFQISVHSWSVPAISQFTRCYSKYPDDVNFEARLFIDGRLVASTYMDREGLWPHVIAHRFELSKNGDLEPLRFPSFRQELLQQNYWSPADDLGRIKLVISEGFPRDSLSMPIERVKNIVVFSFQHAPLEILEASSIAWPNPSMWHRTPLTTSMPVPAYASDDADSHAHSPRRRGSSGVGNSSSYSFKAMHSTISNTVSGTRKLNHQGRSSLSIPGNNNAPDTFGDASAYFEWLGSMGMGVSDANRCDGQAAILNVTQKARKPNADTNMQNFLPVGHGMESAVIMDQQFTLANFQNDDDGHFGYLKVPTNTPTAGTTIACDAEGIPFPLTQNASFPVDMAGSLANSLLNQPMPAHLLAHNPHCPTPEGITRKENRLQPQTVPSPSTMSSVSTSGKDHCDMRNASRQLHTVSGANLLGGTLTSQVNSPQSQICSEMAQRLSSIEDFAASLITGSTSEASLTSSTGSLIEKGTKRSRNFTDASTGTIDDEDEPRRASPRVRLTSFPDDCPTLDT